MKATKNITITENFGFTVRNNGIELGNYNNINKAAARAIEEAEKENKEIRFNTDFWKMTVTAEKAKKFFLR